MIPELKVPFLHEIKTIRELASLWPGAKVDAEYALIVVGLGGAAYSALKRLDLESAKAYLDEMERYVQEDGKR